MVNRYSHKTDEFSPLKIFSHKRVRENLDNLMGIYPITGEMSPSTYCNENCEWCMHDSYFDKKSKTNMPLSLGKDILKQLKDLGMLGMIYAASGEPYLNKSFNDLLRYGSMELCLKQAVITNGSLLNDNDINNLVSYASWVRVSLDAAIPETRFKVHGKDNFDTVIENLRKLASRKKEVCSDINIGAQFIVCPSNHSEVADAVALFRSTGIDYIQIKPVIYHPLDNKPQKTKKFFEEPLRKAHAAREIFENSKFKVHIKDDQFDAIMSPDYGRNYKKCLAIFFPVIEADGKVYHCSQTRGIEDFCIGDLNESSFKDIWSSERRRNVIESIVLDKCQPVCRNHANNTFLDAVINPENKSSFI